jgi:hypothetical protein
MSPGGFKLTVAEYFNLPPDELLSQIEDFIEGQVKIFPYYYNLDVDEVDDTAVVFINLAAGHFTEVEMELAIQDSTNRLVATVALDGEVTGSEGKPYSFPLPYDEVEVALDTLFIELEKILPEDVFIEEYKRW